MRLVRPLPGERRATSSPPHLLLLLLPPILSCFPPLPRPPLLNRFTQRRILLAKDKSCLRQTPAAKCGTEQASVYKSEKVRTLRS